MAGITMHIESDAFNEHFAFDFRTVCQNSGRMQIEF